MIENLTASIFQLIGTFGYFGILVIMIANSVFIPIPTEITLPIAGFLANQNKLSLPLVILVSILGELIGATITFSLGHFIGERFVSYVLEKRRRLLFLNKNSYDKASRWLTGHGFWVIFLAKFIPGLSTPTSLAAGTLKIKYSRFIIIQLLVSLIYNSTFVLLGYYLGNNLESILGLIRKFQIVLVVGIIVIIILYLIRRRKR